MTHWTDAYYGELYLDSVDDLLTPRLSALEADVIAELLGLSAGDRVLDVACGHGRHAWALAGRVGELVGVDRSGAYLRRAATTRQGGGFVRGDVRALPFGDATFDAAYSWYSSLFMFGDAENAAALAELARILRPGGRSLVHHANPLRLALTPCDAARRTLPDGSIVEEEAAFDPATGVERASRRLRRPGGAVLEGRAELRYYSPAEWGPLAESAGLRVVGLTSTTEAARQPWPEPGPQAPDLIALLRKEPT
jgi:SAM-dependent methyltransferase